MPEEEPGSRGANENKETLSLKEVGEAGEGGKDGTEAGPGTVSPSETELESGQKAQREKQTAGKNKICV